MKKIIPILILAVLLLSGCGLREQAQTVDKKYIEPAVSSVQIQTDETDTKADPGPDVYTDSSALTDYIQAETVYSRLSDEPLAQLSPSGDYGALLPFYGESAGLWGLVTESGMIVLDPILTSVDLASYNDGGKPAWLGIYILGKYVKPDEAVSGGTMYALAGKDGSWITGFDYTQVVPMELGVLCVRDGETNDAVCYNETGAVVFDTTDLSDLWRLEPDSITSLAEYSDGYMRICYSNGQYGFMDTDGEILNRYVDRPSYLDDLRPFSEGLAAVELYDQWNYIDEEGVYAIYGLFDEAGDFKNGVAVVKSEGVYAVIDTEGNVLAEFPDAETVTAYDSYIYVKNTDGSEAYLLTPDLDVAYLYDKELHFCDEGYWVVGANGVRMRTFAGEEIYFSGAASLEACAGDGLYLVKLVDGNLAVMDAYSRVMATGDSDLGFVEDSQTGETYIYKVVETGHLDLYTATGALAAENVLPRDIRAAYAGLAYGAYYGPMGGLAPCADKYTSGLKNMENEWVFRIAVDVGD